MKLKRMVDKLNKLLEKNPDLADKHVFLWDEHGERYVSFNNLLKYRKKGFVDKDCGDADCFGEDEVSYTIKDAKDFNCDDSLTSKDFDQIVLL